VILFSAKIRQEFNEAHKQRELELELARKVAQQREHEETLVKVREWIAQKNFVELVNILQSVNTNNLTREYLSGAYPFEGWVGLNQVFQDCKLNLASHEQNVSSLSDQIEQLEKELALLKSKRDEAIRTVDLAKSPVRVETAFQLLANAEQEFFGGFKENLASPDWSVKSMSRNEMKLAFSLLGVPHLLSPLMKVIQDHKVILMLNYHLLEEFKPQMSMEEKLEAIYAVNLIGLKQFNRADHKEKCGVCRIDDVEECFREQGISSELFEKIRNRVGTLKPFQVIMFPSENLLEGDVALTSVEKGNLINAWNEMNRIHSAAV
jgi:hypothetical protein